MSAKEIIVYVVKLVVTGLAFFAGIMVGGLLATALGLQAPATPAGMNMTNAMVYMLLTSPLIGLALAVIARGLAGRFLLRASVLSFFMWIAYAVNTQLEASIFSNLGSGIWFSMVDFAVPSLFCGFLVAFLFPSKAKGESAHGAVRAFLRGRPAAGLALRLAFAAVAFMPIYWVFGMLVAPFTAQYYQQNMFGLQMPSVQQIVAILFVRSLLFLLACLPIVLLWQKSSMALFVRLGLALWILVGLVYMISADWMPVYVRLPHTIEILADEFVYAGVLVLLLFKQPAPAVAKETEPVTPVPA